MEVLTILKLEFPFNWDPQRVGTDRVKKPAPILKRGFHSIGIPSEWGRRHWLGKLEGEVYEKFPFNWDPQRVGTT